MITIQGVSGAALEHEHVTEICFMWCTKLQKNWWPHMFAGFAAGEHAGSWIRLLFRSIVDMFALSNLSTPRRRLILLNWEICVVHVQLSKLKCFEKLNEISLIKILWFLKIPQAKIFKLHRHERGIYDNVTSEICSFLGDFGCVGYIIY